MYAACSLCMIRIWAVACPGAGAASYASSRCDMHHAGVMPALERADDKAGWLLAALLDVGLWPWLAAALLLYIKAGLGRDDGEGGEA